jgi:hypothetical protein
MTRPGERELIRNAIATTARANGSRMVTRRPGWPDPGTVTGPAPLDGIRAAIQLRHAISWFLSGYARSAREAGQNWGEIGEALYDGTTLSPDGWPEEAFAYFAADLGSGPVVPWTCLQCGGTVMDRGPDAGSPADSEPGHRDGCARLAAAVREWDR